ncbi:MULTISPECIES: hypothetical protein [Methylobacterium]|uniref:Secreted protein n=1 Tax=Methylobacterium thuringiense TaxID=1003091 RepID=A0ABQ4TIU2_9HYPH|nr:MULTISPECIES: hypothetical protein [Methylobacterium]TXN23936.1 hypothetical protein FV217_04495 [Methylobacterium sp. WL9]GJE55201.1 hypothetical protein EKPJFOCH_1690 [Methylobacterium thuringiense]
MPSFTGLAFVSLVTLAAAGGRPPTFDVKATCRAAPSLGAGNGNTDQNCLRDETQARTQLVKLWSSFDPRRRALCVQEAGNGGSPSYVDLLTCLQM